MNFIERFAPLSRLQATVLEIGPDTFAILPETTVSWKVHEDHTVVWYRDGDQFRFAQVPQETYLTYAQAVAALLPIDVSYRDTISTDLMAVLESAPNEVLADFAAWAGDYNPERYPSTRETWGWLNHTYGSK
jgi:allophanate hydrolase subunit 1